MSVVLLVAGDVLTPVILKEVSENLRSCFCSSKGVLDWSYFGIEIHTCTVMTRNPS